MSERINIEPYPDLTGLNPEAQAWLKKVLEAMAYNFNNRLSPKLKHTAIGGTAVQLTNKSGADSVVGKLVKADTATNDAVILTGATDDECIGVFLDAGVPDGNECWVVIDGIADVLYDDNVAAVRGNWVGTGQAGLARTQGAPPGLGVAAHFEEIGHAIESVSAGGGGTFILGRCKLQFN